MVLEFKDYKKKIKKNIILELDFRVESGEILSIVSNEIESLKLIKKSLREKVSFKGEILFNEKNSSKEKLIFLDDYGFYNHLSLIKNLGKLLQLFGVKISQEEIEKELQFINLNPSVNYKKLSKNEKIKLHLLFSILINQNLVVIDNSEETLTLSDKIQIRELILTKSTNENIIILDTMLNQFNDIADSILVISDSIKSYYGSIDDLLIIKTLAVLSISSQDNLEHILRNYQFTIYSEKEIVIRDEVLEEVLYELLKNNIEVHQVRNLGEKIKLYQGKGEEL